MGIIESNYKSKIDNFINEMDKIPDNEYFHQNSDKFSELLIDVVHAIADCYERNRDKLGSTDKDFICAFRYLNNQLKHDTNLDVFMCNSIALYFQHIYHAYLELLFVQLDGQISKTMADR